MIISQLLELVHAFRLINITLFKVMNNFGENTKLWPCLSITP